MRAVGEAYVSKLYDVKDKYVRTLLKGTLAVGLASLLLILVYKHTPLGGYTIPGSVHTILGLVIGLCIVFRVNTSYDRWWEGRKMLEKIASRLVLVREMDEHFYGKLVSHVNDFASNLSVGGRSSIDGVARLYAEGARHDTDRVTSHVLEVLDAMTACYRIRDTPIPYAFSAHIKASILLYVLTLPFGLFQDMGYWSTAIVMFSFYVVAGIELIANEIEDPFRGDPNDLDVRGILGAWSA